MKVLVIGATGATGQLAVKQLLARGDDVTALARDPAAIAEKHARLTVMKGQASDAASLEQALAGQEAVLVAFGPRSLGKTDVQETLMRNLLASMKKTGVTRLINLSGWGAGDSLAHASFFMKVIQATVLKNIYQDKNRGEALLTGSDVNYTNVRPGRLLNSSARGGVRANLDGKGLKPEMTREDLAAFMIAQLTSDAWTKKSPIIGY
ncbi:MAG: SDR family oxidoreductase [Deltaproteobacteria bacterium]|nr:SDR family oxidoreductase [Deltaproteobacteria bacterium]